MRDNWRIVCRETHLIDFQKASQMTSFCDINGGISLFSVKWIDKQTNNARQHTHNPLSWCICGK